MVDSSIGFQRYIEGCSPLHRALPSVKLLLLPVVIALSFSASNYLQLVCIVGFVFLGYSVANVPTLYICKSVWRLKYLLGSTVLLHLFLTPGRVLWQMPWLSLDGLLVGLFVSIKLILALLCAQLFSYVTTFGELVSGARQLANGLFFIKKRRVENILFTLSSVCYFMPIVSREGKGRVARVRAAQCKTEALWCELQSLIDCLLLEVDKVSSRYISGDNPFALPGDSTLGVISKPDAIILGFVALLIVLVVMVL